MKLKIEGIIVWLIVSLFVIYSFSLNTAAAVFEQSIKTTLNANDIDAALAMGAFILGFAVMQIPAGYLLDKYPARLIVSLGVFLLAAGNLFISFANNLFLFSLANFLQGVGGSFSFIAAGLLISQWFNKKLFPILFGLTQTLSCLLTGIIHYLFVYELKIVTWNKLYQFLAFLGLILFIFTVLFVKNPPKSRSKKSPRLWRSLTEVCCNKQVWLCTFSAATSFGVVMAYASFWYLDIQDYYSVASNDALMISSLIFIGIGVGTPLLAWLSNYKQSRNMIIHVSLVLGTMMLLLGIYLPHFNIASLGIIKSVSFLIGFFLAGSMLFYTVINEITADGVRGLALSVINTGVFLFNSLLLFIPYLFITTVSKTFLTYLWILPFCVLFAILLIYFIQESY